MGSRCRLMACLWFPWAGKKQNGWGIAALVTAALAFFFSSFLSWYVWGLIFLVPAIALTVISMVRKNAKALWIPALVLTAGALGIILIAGIEELIMSGGSGLKDPWTGYPWEYGWGL